uniref:BTB domain-containing protein n=1 Tax=Heterorhabditis bacteriophora TaxID=37862 RepID=A0A1I7XM13_HETBA
MSKNSHEPRKRKHTRWNHAVKQKYVEAGLSGLFFTCDNHEKQALAEAYNIIDELMDQTDTGVISSCNVEDSSCDAEFDEDVADSLKRICNESRGTGQKRLCKQRPTGVRNCLFVTVQGAEVVTLAERMVKFAQTTPRCRYLQRVLPVEETAEIDLQKMSEIIAKCVSRHLVAKSDGSFPSYAMEFKARNNDSLKKSDILEMFGDAVNAIAPTARVDLNDAQPSSNTIIEAHHFSDPRQPSAVMAQLAVFRNESSMCDITLEANGQTLTAHRFILASAIPYFRAMFGSDMMESKMDKIVINDISFDSLRCLVDFVYTSEITIDSDNVQSLLFAASILQMDSVCAACQRFLTQFLTTRNCLSIRQFAERHNCVDLLNSSDDFAVDHFTAWACSKMRCSGIGTSCLSEDVESTELLCRVCPFLFRTDSCRLTKNQKQYMNKQVFDAVVHPSSHIPSSRTSSHQAHMSDIYQYRVEKGSLPILNESGPHPAGTLLPTSVPSKPPSVVESQAPQAHLSSKSQKRNRLQEWKAMCTRPPMAVCILLLFFILIVAAIVTIVLVQVLAVPKSAVMSWIAPEILRGGQNTPSSINMKSNGQQNRVAIIDESLKSNRKNIACFVIPLDRNNIQDISSMLKASSSAAHRREQSRGWQETWNYLPSPLLINAQTLFDPPIPECEGVRWIQLEYTSSNQKSRKCSDCYDFCLPDYGIEKDNVRDEEYLNILRRNCFYLFVPEWRSFTQTNSVDQDNWQCSTWFAEQCSRSCKFKRYEWKKWKYCLWYKWQYELTGGTQIYGIYDKVIKFHCTLNPSTLQGYDRHIMSGNSDGNGYNQQQNVERTMTIADNGVTGMTQQNRELNVMGTPSDSFHRYENGNGQNHYSGRLAQQTYTSQTQNGNVYGNQFGQDGQFPFSSDIGYNTAQGTNTRQPYPDSSGVNPPSGYIPQVGPQIMGMRPQGVAGMEIPSSHHSGYTPDVITNQQPVNMRWMTNG